MPFFVKMRINGIAPGYMPEGTLCNIGKYGLMNNVGNAVEEIVLRELVYV